MWIINRSSELDNSSNTAELSVTLLPAKSNDDQTLNDFHKTQFIITTVLFTLGLFGNISIILALRGLKSITSILTIYLAIIDTLSLMSKDIADGLIYLNTENFGTLYCDYLDPFSGLVSTSVWCQLFSKQFRCKYVTLVLCLNMNYAKISENCI
ncbi:G-protein coupled receptor, partial [Biomphalaria glabrata]